MKQLYVTILLATTLALSGCSTSSPPKQSGLGTKNVQPISVSGTFLHEKSGIRFPETIGQFKRVGIDKYEVVSLGLPGEIQNQYNVKYRLPGDIPEFVGALIYQIPFYPSESATDDFILKARRALFDIHSKRLLSEIQSDKNLANIKVLDFSTERMKKRVINFTFIQKLKDRSLPMNTYVAFFTKDGWFVRTKHTFPLVTENYQPKDLFHDLFLKQILDDSSQ